MQAELIAPPKRFQNPPNADLSKYCHYHCNNGHTTEECETLRDKIEELIRAGHLRHYVRNITEGNPRTQPERCPQRNIPRREDARNEPKESRQEPRRGTNSERRREEPPRGERRPEERPPLRGMINTILGGFAGGGCSSSSRKKHLRAVRSVHAICKGPRRRMPPITFSDSDFQGVNPNQDDPVVITIELENFAVKKVLIDQGSSVDIIYWKTFQQLQIPAEELIPYDEPIYGFSGERVPTRGYVDLHTTFGEGRQTRTIQVRYLIVDAHTSYNMLLGRPSLNLLGAVVSTPHLALKFPSASGDIITVHGDQKAARECYMASLKLPYPPLTTNNVEKTQTAIAIQAEDLDPRLNNEARIEPVGETKPLPLGQPNHFLQIGTTMESAGEEAIENTLKKNADLFAWTAADLPGVDPRIAAHKLSVFKEAKPISQKKRKRGEERRQAAKCEAEKLMKAGFVKEARYTT